MLRNQRCIKLPVSFLLVVTLLVTMLSGIGFAWNKPIDENVDYSVLLNRLGISAVGDSEAHITRGDFTVMAVQASGTVPADEREFFNDVSGEQAKYINAAAAFGFVRGEDDSCFYPDRVISFAEAAIILRRVLGYDNVNNSETAYTPEYLLASVNAQLAQGVNASDKLTCKDASTMIFNMLDSKYVKFSGVDPNGEAVYTESSNTMLNDKFGVYAYNGTIQAIGRISLNAVNETDDEYIIIDSNRYLNLYYNDYNLLGTSVRYYIMHNDDENELIFISKDYSNCLTLNIRDINSAAGFDSTDSVANKQNPYVKYFEGNNVKATEIDIDPKATIILNGEKSVAVSNADFTTNPGKVTFIDGNGDSVYDVIMIEKYVYYRVSMVERTMNKIFDKAGKETIDLEYYDGETFKVFANNAEVSGDDIGNGAVLQVMCSYKENGEIDYDKAITIEIISKTATGTITMFEENDVLYLDDVKYYILPEIREGLNVGDTTTFYLGIDDVIVEYDKVKQTDSALYGYLVARDKENGIYEDVSFMIYNSKNEMFVAQAAEDFKYTGMYNGTYVSKRNIKKEQIFDLIAPKQLIMYKLNDEGKISLIELAYDYTNESDYDGYDPNRFSLEWHDRNNTLHSTYITESYNATWDTMYFYVSTESTDEDDFEVGSFARYGNGTRTGSTKIYDADRTLRAGVVVIEDANLDEIVDKSFFDSKYPTLITDKKIVMDKDGNEVIEYTAHEKAGGVTLRAAKENLAPLNDYLGVTSTTITRFEDLNEGDIISYERNLQGEVCKFVVLNEYDEKQENTYYEARYNGDKPKHIGYYNISLGHVTKFSENSNFMLDCSETRRYSYTFQPIFFYIYNVRTSEVNYVARTVTHLDEGDYVFVNSQYNRINCIILYVND